MLSLPPIFLSDLTDPVVKPVVYSPEPIMATARGALLEEGAGDMLREMLKIAFRL